MAKFFTIIGSIVKEIFSSTNKVIIFITNKFFEVLTINLSI